MKPISEQNLLKTLSMLEEVYRASNPNDPALHLVVCGGSALLARELVLRTTKDVDVLAQLRDGKLQEAAPLPDSLVEAAQSVAKELGLPNDWLNTGPADLFRMGLPQGLQADLLPVAIGPKLSVHFIGRKDQIFFKLYASVDRGGYHMEDLLALHPSEEELLAAAQWSMTHDVSEGFATMMRSLLKHLGFADVAGRL